MKLVNVTIVASPSSKAKVDPITAKHNSLVNDYVKKGAELLKKYGFSRSKRSRDSQLTEIVYTNQKGAQYVLEAWLTPGPDGTMSALFGYKSIDAHGNPEEVPSTNLEDFFHGLAGGKTSLKKIAKGLESGSTKRKLEGQLMALKHAIGNLPTL